MSLLRLFIPSLVMTPLAALSAHAQGAPEGWSVATDGLALYQGDADLDDGGSFSVNRVFLRAGALYNTDAGLTAGVGLSVGELNYQFDDSAIELWGDVTDLRLAVPLTWRSESGAQFLAIPQFRWDYEDGASASDGFTGGLFAGVAWQVNDRLRIGPAFGVFSQLEDDAQVFPALLIDWQFADRWSLSTGNAPGATQGPGLTLTHQVSDEFSLSLSARYEEAQFRLRDNNASAAGGVGEDSSVPVVVAIQYAPNPAVSLSVFAGAELNGSLTTFDSDGNKLGSQEYDTAPVAGFAFRVRF